MIETVSSKQVKGNRSFYEPSDFTALVRRRANVKGVIHGVAKAAVSTFDARSSSAADTAPITRQAPCQSTSSMIKVKRGKLFRNFQYMALHDQTQYIGINNKATQDATRLSTSKCMDCVKAVAGFRILRVAGDMVHKSVKAGEHMVRWSGVG